MIRFAKLLASGAAAAIAFAAMPSPGHAAESAVARGKYLVTVVGGCSDCHTPGALMGKPDMARLLGGSDVGFAIPGMGVFVPPNLTPDQETGLGKWSKQQIITAFTTGKRPDGRVLAPIMPWHELAHLKHQDALAIADYLKSLKPVRNPTPGPFGPGQKVSVFVMTVVPAQVYNGMPHPGGEPGKTP